MLSMRFCMECGLYFRMLTRFSVHSWQRCPCTMLFLEAAGVDVTVSLRLTEYRMTDMIRIRSSTIRLALAVLRSSTKLWYRCILLLSETW